MRRADGGPDRRGNSIDRARRKRWMLCAYGNGKTCPCTHCGCPLTYRTVEADRINPGGSYRRANVVPSCRICNAARGERPWEGPRPWPREEPC